MALLVCHVDKFKQVDLKGIENHNDRKSLHSKNKEIDYSRTSRNFDAITGKEGNPSTNYPKIANLIIESQYTGTRAIRKDAVKAVSVLVTAGKQFFENMSDRDQKYFFATAAKYLVEQFGMKNVIAAKVHRDEATPHMHFSFVPMCEGRLSAKTLIDRKMLFRLQEDLPKALQLAGFAIERGVVESENEHMDTHDYKRNLALVKKEASKITRTTERISAESKIEKASFFDSSEIVKLPKKDYDFLISVAKDYAALALENKTLELNQSQNVPKLRREKEAFEESARYYSETCQKLESQLADYKKVARYVADLKHYAPKEYEYLGGLVAKRMREAKEQARCKGNDNSRNRRRTNDLER